MVSRGYHSPQFSEDIAWLPAWLQPHQLPAFGDGAKDEHTISQLSCKNMALLPKYVSAQDSQLSTKGDDEYSGLHLYLSGDDSPPVGSIPSSAEGLHFHLHLSSLGISQFSKSQPDEIPKPEKHGTKVNLSKKHVHKIPPVQDDTICTPKLEGEACASKSSMERKSRGSCKQIKAGQKKQKRLAGNHNNMNISNAVELCIAASEAMIISDMVTSDMQFENLPAAAILEIALRVKQARKDSSVDNLEAACSFPADEICENYSFSDLDESTMADAYDDVGMSLTQIIESPDNLHDSRKSIQSNSSTRISESPMGIGEETQSNKLKDTIAQACVAVSLPKYLALQSLPLQKTWPSAFVPLDCNKSCSKSQQEVDAQNMQQSADSLIPIQTGAKEDRDIYKKDGKLSEIGDAIVKKIITVYNMETSFLSESMDVMDEGTPKHIEEAEPQMAASSNTPPGDLLRCPYSESQRSIHKGHGLSQDIVRSSIFSSVDPLCSVVPCSIASEDAPMSCEKLTELKTAVSSKELNENVVLLDVQQIPLKPLAERVPILSNNSIEVPAVPSRRQFNSLRNYSTCFMLNTIDSEISFKPMDRWREMDELKDNHCPRSKDKEKVRPSAVVEDENADVGSLFDHHEERDLPTVLNNKKRRLRACKEILSCDREKEGLENSLTSKIKKCKVVNSTSDVKWKDLTDVISHIPVQSNSCSHPADKQSHKIKKVQFLEAEISIDKTKNNNKLQNKHWKHGSCHISSKRVKESKHLACKKGMIFQGLEFLLTGFSSQKNQELEALIRLYGGYVLSNIPLNPPDLRRKQRAGLAQLKLPIILSPKKVQTTKFLYGCATNTWMVNANWLVDSIHAGCLLSPGKFMIRPIQGSKTNYMKIGEPFCLNNHTFIFERVGIMVNGKVSFCTKFSKIVKHGGGKVFKSLQRLVQSLKNGTNTLGVVLVENEYNVSRHLKHCALENNLQTLPASWIINSLYSGKLLPLNKDRSAHCVKLRCQPLSLAQDDDMSEEI